jgi:CheY-like chemotaxis protein
VLGEDKICVVDLADDVGHVRADPGQLDQVLLNLTLNARDAMPPGGTFTISTRQVAFPKRDEARRLEDELPPGAYVRLTASDTGHGMNAATRARVFEPFFTTKPIGQGTGLGLATAFGIVRQSAGTLRLYSTPGRGSTFNIYLPVVSDAVTPRADLRSLPRGESASGTVLVVEDEALVRDFTCRVLTVHGYRPLEAANGAEALDTIRQSGEVLHAVITDVVMPGVGGGTLARRLAELHPSVPVLFTSGYPAEELVGRGLVPPDVPFLQKPFTPEALIAKLRALADSGARTGPDH